MQMQVFTRFIAALALISMSLVASDQVNPLYNANSKAQGASFELLVNETERLSTKSYLSVPGFHERTAPTARWMMCSFTALALERGFTHWSVVYPDAGSTQLVVGFSNSDITSPMDVLGTDYVKKRAIGKQMMPVKKMINFRGIKR